jgi:hypothetical protein
VRVFSPLAPLLFLAAATRVQRWRAGTWLQSK